MPYHFDRESERQATVVQLADATREQRDQLMAEYRARSEAAFAPSTMRNYRMIIRLFTQWCTENSHDPTPPVPPRVIAEYVDHLGGKIKSTTIECRLWAISELHRSHFQPNPCRHRLVELALMAVKRTYGAAIGQAPPLGKGEVLEVIKRLGESRREMRDKALLWIASDSWCRASEIVAFRVRDIERQPDGASLLFVHRSKTDPYGQGAYAYLSRPGTEAVFTWITLAGLRRDDPILTKSQPNGKIAPLNPRSLSQILKKATNRPDVSAHSTRIGGVHDALRLGCDLSSIMVAGRWRSPEMPARYGRKIRASQSAAAKVAETFLSNTGGSGEA
ncbi:tyrosine-type recombinase/integrase [Pseudooceanicola nanhaiensis]|uniref:tyrosine-type recombinase/integrase n=1 Tax=Pseudooceanicola nanhaiensis TaxID=375761 RepID=UPI0030092E23